MLTLFKTLNLALAFFLELFMLYAFGYWGFHLKQSTGMRWLIGIGLPILVAIIWGVFLAPKSMVHMPHHLKLLGKFILMETAAALLYSTGKTNMAIIFAVITVVNLILILAWKQ